ncbi:MAG: CoA-binding protein [Burkholderiaceae bacterium]|nr:CoA-binding protein [Burkholderiaceae bacterium]
MPDASPETILSVLRDCRTIAVVGLSPKTHRDSYHVAEYLQQQGYRIVPINPQASEILGQRCWPSLTEAAQHGPIDVVDVFRNSADVPPIADEAIAIGAKALWLQLGVRHDEAAARARAAGLQVVQERCTLVEHGRLQGLGQL